MIYIATFKGYIDELKYDLQLNRNFWDVGMGYFKEEIEAETDEELSAKIAEITKSGNFKCIGSTPKT